MSITQKSVKLLWAGAAGRCSFPGCWERLCPEEAGACAPYTIGEQAHIKGKRSGSNRYDPNQTPEERDDYANLILMCPTHHSVIDERVNEAHYTADLLLGYKADHEALVLDALDQTTSVEFDSVLAAIAGLLADNKLSWQQYGPYSIVAIQEPNNEQVYAVWQAERLTTITPNNRKIADLLRQHRAQFSAADQVAISSFLAHANSYERWVLDELPYNAVVRFPVEFEAMIQERVNASS